MSFQRLQTFLQENEFEFLHAYQSTGGKLLYIHIRCLKTCYDFMVKVNHQEYRCPSSTVLEQVELSGLDIFTLASNQVFDYYKRPEVPVSLDPKLHALDIKSLGRQLKRFSLLALDTDYHLIIQHKHYLFVQTHKTQLKVYSMNSSHQHSLHMFPLFSLACFFQKYQTIGDSIGILHERRMHAFQTAVRMQVQKLEELSLMDSYKLRLGQIYEIQSQFSCYRIKFQEKLKKICTQLQSIAIQKQECKQYKGQSVERDLQLNYRVEGLENDEKGSLEESNTIRRLLIELIEEEDEFLLLSDQVFFNNLAMLEQIGSNMRVWDQKYRNLLQQ